MLESFVFSNVREKRQIYYKVHFNPNILMRFFFKWLTLNVVYKVESRLFASIILSSLNADMILVLFYQQSISPGDSVTVCRYMVGSSEICARITEATRLFCIRTMVGCLILFDHIDENGAFVRDSPINVRAVVNIVKEQTQPPQVSILYTLFVYAYFNISILS
ncbi:hypothetical protein DICVIV_04106 [Dictyocaulus viviparus]|uniref:CYRIA/CYRIB Rac1 binding domain-containing protein n=1 Tax=Dictyocaulus viviparus TaxID=29172 RepID=A0A0D8Y5D6_DICVI|nr:hypothetical protein DICVIV_04106 [Dictyocaulus viviparus]